MENDWSRESASPRTRRAIALTILGIVLALTCALDLVARNRSLTFRMEQEYADWVRPTRELRHIGAFDTTVDRILLDEWPNADYSRGSVCVMGSSTAVVATRLWELPEAQRALIHNYSFAGTCHKMHFQLLRYLIEHENLLKAGGAKR